MQKKVLEKKGKFSLRKEEGLEATSIWRKPEKKGESLTTTQRDERGGNFRGERGVPFEGRAQLGPKSERTTAWEWGMTERRTLYRGVE